MRKIKSNQTESDRIIQWMYHIVIWISGLWRLHSSNFGNSLGNTSTHTHSINSKSCKLFIHSTFQTIRQIDKRGAKTELHVKLFVIQEMELKCDNRRSTQSHDTHTNKHIHLWNVNDDICDNNNNRNSNNDDDNAMMLWQTETDWSASKDTKICTEILFCCGFWSK